MNKIKFMFFVTGTKENDAIVRRYLCNTGYCEDLKYVFFKLFYTPPYIKEFNGIADFEKRTQYSPFQDSIIKDAVAVINISEWIGCTNTELEYFIVFLQFIHDYRWSFHEYEYIFTCGDCTGEEVKRLYKLVSGYLHEGKIVEEYIMQDVKCMSDYLSSFPVTKEMANRLSKMLIGRITDFVQLNMIMDDLIERLKASEQNPISEKNIYLHREKIKDSKLEILGDSFTNLWNRIVREDAYGKC